MQESFSFDILRLELLERDERVDLDDSFARYDFLRKGVTLFLVLFVVEHDAELY